MSKIFISRALSPESLFKSKLEAADLEVHGESLIQFDPVPFQEVPPCDWVFFYSRNAVRFYFAGLQNPDFWKGKKLRQGPARREKPVKYAAYGSATAAYLTKHHQVKVQFIGSAKPSATAQSLMTMAAGERILFPCAKHSLHSLYKYIRYKTDATKLVVYDNRIRDEFDLPTCDILVFTSPLNAQAYFGKYQWKKKQKVLAIGRTTAGALKKLGITKVAVAKKAKEEALAELVLEQLD